MVPLLLIAQLAIATPQERVVVIRDRTGKVTGTLRSSGQRPTPAEGLAILCAGDRCDPRGYAALAEQEPVLIPIRGPRPQAETPDSFKLHPLPPYLPTPAVQSVPLPYPTVRVIQ